MHCAGFLLLCMTTSAPRTIENLRVHKLTLPHENLKLKMESNRTVFHDCLKTSTCNDHEQGVILISDFDGTDQKWFRR